MKQSLLTGYNTTKFQTHWFALLSLAVLGRFFLTNWPIYHFLILDGPVTLPYYALACVMAVTLIFFNPAALNFLLREPLFYWFLVYAISGLLWLIMIDDGYLDSQNSLWRQRFLFMLLFSACTILVASVDHQKLAKVWLGCALFGAICYWAEFFSPFLFIPLGHELSGIGRSAGWFLDANTAAGVLVGICIATAPFVSQQWRVFLVAIISIGIFPTLSRSGFLFSGFVIAMWLWSGQFSKRTLVVLLIALPFSVIIGTTLFNKGIESPDVNYKNVMERIDSLQGGKTTDHSANERRYVAELGWTMFSESPFSGYGTGKVMPNSKVWHYSQSTHNTYLLIMLEQGIFGGILYLLFLGIIYVRGIRLYWHSLSRYESDLGISLILIASYFAFLGFFSHTLLMEGAGILLLASLLAEERKIARAKIQRSFS